MSTEEKSASTELEHLSPRAVNLAEHLGIRFADPGEVQWAIAERLAVANSPEELFGDNGPRGLRDNIGKPFLVRNVSWLPGRFDDGPGFFALIEATDVKTGELVQYTSGAFNVLIQLARAAQMGWLDKPVRAEQSKTPTADGYYPYRLVFS